MFSKLAPPTPTMTMDRGSLDAATILSTVSDISDIIPSWKMQIKISHNGEEDHFNTHLH